VTLAWFDSSDGLRGWLEYNSDIFDDKTISRLQGHYRTLIEGVIADPDERVSRIPLLTGMERQQFAEWNRTEAAFPADACIHNAFESQADRTPDAIAIETKNSQVTYEELNRRANRLAHYLRRLGIDKESLVGVAFERDADLWTALLAVLKAGAAYVPLDPAYPRERLAFMQQDSGIRILLTHEKWESIFANTETKIICLDQVGQELAQERGENPGISIPSTSPAYVIYTSGSTGQPKGVLGLHCGAMNRFFWMRTEYSFESGEVACAKTSLNFVDSVWESFGPLLAGIKTVVIPDADVKSPISMIGVLARHKVTRLVMVPSLLSALLDAEPEIGNRLPHLQYWISSGESLSVNLVRRFREALPGRILLNLYGSSEVSADVTCFDTREMPPRGPALIGKPISNMKTYVLDKNLKPVPIGISGQLCVAGAGVARGYLNRPEQSAAKFLPHPSGAASEPLYLTGDLARFRGDGNIELLGRIDNQVKIRGVRVEPEEIEFVMCRHPGVVQAVVTAKNGAQTEARLIAYVVPAEHVTEGEFIPQLRQHLRETLPEQMVPSAFLVVSRLPLLPNGKIDRHALPEPDSGFSNQGVTAPQSCGPTEERIRRVWQEALRVERVGIHDNFFDLGGHSLLLAAVQNKLAREFHREIKSVDVYRHPTISALAKCLDDVEAEQRPLKQAQERARKQREMLQRRRTSVTMRPE
jgi:amino acid adenylation domain-containing protein